jgi:hypothetical protein
MSIMTDTTNISTAAKNVGAKPRLSVLSSKQSCSRLKSEDYTPDQTDTCSPEESGPQCNGLLNATNDETETKNNVNPLAPAKANISNNDARGSSYQSESAYSDASFRRQVLTDQSGAQQQQQQQRAFDKLSVSKEDLIALLSMLKSELHSKEIALASMKLEQLKRLINPVEISRSSLAKTYIELQDRLKAKDQIKNGNIKQKQSTNLANSSAFEKTVGEKQLHIINHTHQDNNNNNSRNNSDDDDGDDDSDQETIEILSTLLELLDRHPLLALPRDSIYCLDYSCNELSTKNYLNLKIQHLENLIDQHRKFRYHVRERLKRSEQRSLDLTLKLELERKFRADSERSAYRNSGKAILLGHIDRLKDDLEKEKANKHAIVMTLLNELLDERERNKALSDRVTELEKKLVIATQTQQASPPTMTNQQSICKPRVPAKPAQLLDRQLSQSKTKQ